MPHTRRIFRFRIVAAAVAAGSALGLSACGGTSDQQARVPALDASGSATASASAPADADAGRPRERLDMTDDEVTALSRQYERCMAANGWDRTKNPRDQAAMAKAQRACRSKKPLPPWELDASNPQSADFVHAVVKCLRAKGVRYVSEEPPQDGRSMFSFGGPGNDPESIRKGMEYTPACEKQVAAQGVGR